MFLGAPIFRCFAPGNLKCQMMGKWLFFPSCTLKAVYSSVSVVVTLTVAPEGHKCIVLYDSPDHTCWGLMSLHIFWELLAEVHNISTPLKGAKLGQQPLHFEVKITAN